MATIVTRAGKGSPLTHTEVDANFTNLNTDKVESSALATVATSGAYGDLSGLPTLGTAAATAATDYATAAQGAKVDGIEAGADVTDTANVTAAGALMDSEVTNLAQVKAFDGADYATAAQGTLADSSTQPGDNVSTLTNDAGYSTTTGTVTNVGGTGAVNGLSLSGTVTSSGNLTLGGTLAISNADWSGTDLSVANGGTGASTLAANNVLLGNGASALQTVAPGASGNVLTSNGTTWQSTALAAGGGTLEATASGALANGDLVVVNSDGTVSVVAETAVSQSVSSPGFFLNAAVSDVVTTFDSNSNKVVVVYSDPDASLGGRAVVGTVSGTSISFGTPVSWEASEGYNPTVTFDSNSNKVVIFFRQGSSYGGAIVGTVSGTSISFGTKVSVNSVNTVPQSIGFDPVNNTVVATYRDYNNSSYGTAVVGTVSGTSISFGTPVVFNSSSTDYSSVAFDVAAGVNVIAFRDLGGGGLGKAVVGTVSGTSISFGSTATFESGNSTYQVATYDSFNEKIVISYTDDDNSLYGTAVVGTVSGTSISFGTPVVFESASTAWHSITFAENSNNVVLSYRDSGNSNRGTVIVGTVSGTSISFGTAVVFETGETDYVSSVYDSNSDVVSINYRDDANGDRGTTVVFQTAYDQTSLTATNYIGISDGAYSDTATATVQIIGSVDDAQSGLTAGQAYYVQADGTLSTTAGSPSVFAGTAVSATEIIVKG